MPMHRRPIARASASARPVQRHHQRPQPDYRHRHRRGKLQGRQRQRVFNPADTVAWNATDGGQQLHQRRRECGKPKPWQDTSEPFLNEWELYDSFGTPTYVAGEPFIDFNNNGQRDGPDGPGRKRPVPGSALRYRPHLGRDLVSNNIIILSGSSANLARAVSRRRHAFQRRRRTCRSRSRSLTIGCSKCPTATTVAATVASGGTRTITSPPPAKWPCSTAAPYRQQWVPIAGQHSLSPSRRTIPAPRADIGGSLFITVTTPRGLVTTTFYDTVAP